MKSFKFICTFIASYFLFSLAFWRLVTGEALNESTFQALMLAGIGWCILEQARHQLSERKL